MTKQPGWRRRGIWLTVLGAWLLVAGPITWIFGWPYLTFEMATIQCGHRPVIASKFMAGYDYTLPGDPGYGPSFLDNGPYYCAAADADGAGYHRAPR